MQNITPSSEVRKHVSAVHVSGELSLLERRLVNLLLLNAYDDLPSKRKFTLPVSTLYAMLDVKSNNIDHLKKALLGIMSTPITFDLFNSDKKKGKWAAAPPLSYAGIEDGICTYEYSEFLAERLANPDIYAVISIGVQRKLRGAYALALYENCVRYVKRPGYESGTGWIAVDMWRALLGAQSELYNAFKRFSDKVLKPAIAEVNALSNITITPEYKRENRSVVAIRFDVEYARQQSLIEISEAQEAEIRASELFTRLNAIGIGGQLAIAWIQQTPERALLTAIATEEAAQKARNKPIRNIGAYAQAVYATEPERLKRPPAAEKPPEPMAGKNAVAQREEAEKDAQAAKTRAMVASLTDGERSMIAAEFIAETGSTSYDSEQGRFKKAAENTAYRAFTIQRASGVVAARGNT
jgi:plasmid replication initiation protein